jgi:phage-related protein
MEDRSSGFDQPTAVSLDSFPNQSFISSSEDRTPNGMPAARTEISPDRKDVKDHGGAGTASKSQVVGTVASSLGAQAAIQARLINSDSTLSELQVSRIAASRRQQISSHFSGIRKSFSSLFDGLATNVRKSISTKQAQLSAAAAGVLGSVQKVVTDTLAAAQSQSDHVRQAITSFIQSTTASLQAKVQGISNQIVGFINAIPLPDIPGIAQIRNAAANFLRQAAGVVNNALGQVLGVIRQAFNAGMDMLASLLNGVGRSINQALSAARSEITHIVRSIAQALNQAAGRIISTLKTVLTMTLTPGVNRVERSIAGAISKAEQQTRAAIQANRQQHLKALDSVLHPAASTGGANSGRGGLGDARAAIKQIGQEAIHNNQLIVQSFEEKTSGTIALVFQAITSTAERVVQGIAAGVAQVVQLVAGKVEQVVQGVFQVLQGVANFLQTVMQAFSTLVSGALDWVRSFVRDPAGKLLEFAESAWSRIRGFASTLVHNLISGGGVASSISAAIGEFQLASSTTAPLRGPITKPSLPIVVVRLLVEALIAAFGALLVVLFGEELAAIIMANPVLALIVAVAIVVVVLILLLLLYLLFHWLKPKPVPPPQPQPPACAITTRTLLAAPDGTASSRTTVGVNEQVELTASTSVTWTATCGKLLPTGGTTAIWTAPDKKSRCTVNATPAMGASRCSVTLSVIPPSARALTKNHDRGYTAGLAGSGFEAKVVIVPTNVSFSRIQVREDTVTSTANGYYDKVLHWNGIAHPVGKWLPVDGTNSGIIDTVGTNPPGSPGPFSKGTFHWPIPQQYRVPGTGSAIKYSTGDHVQDMTGSTGEETTTKEGAKGGPRKP